MIDSKRLDHVQLCSPVGKENEARKFYTDIIGLVEIPKPKELIKNGGLWYQIANERKVMSYELLVKSHS